MLDDQDDFLPSVTYVGYGPGPLQLVSYGQHHLWSGGMGRLGQDKVGKDWIGKSRGMAVLFNQLGSVSRI